jgi:hypothetical protein
MPTARYRFIRNRGVFTLERASTDAIRALTAWESGAAGRSHHMRVENDESLEADLSWSDSDTLAGDQLNNACRDAGVERIHLS